MIAGLLFALLAADSVSGSVVNSATGETISHALVQCNQTAVFTDATGRFEIANMPAGIGNCFARKPGYFSDQEIGKGQPPGYRKLGSDSTPIVLKLTPASVLTGRVTDSDDDPVENAWVQPIAAVYVNGRKRWQPRGAVNTDEDGQYRIGNLPPGTYIISVSTGSLALPNGPEPMAYPLQVFYPNVPDRSLATPIDFRPAQVQRADFSLRLQRAFRLTGTVTNPTGGAAANGVHLAAPDGQMTRGPWQFHPDTGQFEFRNLPAGSYLLVGFGNDGQGHAYSAQKQIQLSRDLDKVTLPLESRAIPVVIRNEFTNPPSPPATLQMPRAGQFRPPLLNVQLESLDTTTQLSATNEGPQDSPVLVIRNAPPGRYAVQFHANPYYVESAICGGVDLLREPLVIGESGATPPIQVTLRDGSGAVNVTFDGRGEGLARLFFFRESAPMQQPTMLFADEAMRGIQESPLRMQNLAPGNYFVLAFTGASEFDYANPEAILPYMSQAAHFSVDRGGEASVTVKVIKRQE